MKQWYVVNTKAREEPKASFNLKRQGFNSYLPQYKKTRRHARRMDTVLAPLFPKYLFIEFDLDLESWSSINSTAGVKKLIMFGSLPATLPSELVEEIRTREDVEGVVSLSQYLKIKQGDQVTINSGAFNEHRGIFECQDDDKRIIILLKLMGRDVRVRLASSAISV
jgi:transcriptional antiterminator RfaH